MFLYFYFYYKWQWICILVYSEVGTSCVFFKLVSFPRLPCTDASILDDQSVLHRVVLCYKGTITA